MMKVYVEDINEAPQVDGWEIKRTDSRLEQYKNNKTAKLRYLHFTPR